TNPIYSTSNTTTTDQGTTTRADLHCNERPNSPECNNCLSPRLEEEPGGGWGASHVAAVPFVQRLAMRHLSWTIAVIALFAARASPPAAAGPDAALSGGEE